MKVHELIRWLSDMPSEAEVYLLDGECCDMDPVVPVKVIVGPRKLHGGEIQRDPPRIWFTYEHLPGNQTAVALVRPSEVEYTTQTGQWLDLPEGVSEEDVDSYIESYFEARATYMMCDSLKEKLEALTEELGPSGLGEAFRDLAGGDDAVEENDEPC